MRLDSCLPFSRLPSSLRLGAATLLAALVEYVGFLGTGSVVQSGGTNTVSGQLYLGYSSGASGIYTLSAGHSLRAVSTWAIPGSDTLYSPAAPPASPANSISPTALAQWLSTR